MATEKAETDRVPITLALSTISYLEKLVRQGTHGTSVPGVAKTLMEEGIRLAIKDGLLAIRDIDKTPNGREPLGRTFVARRFGRRGRQRELWGGLASLEYHHAREGTHLD